MLPTVQTYAKAQDVAQIICHILVDEMKLQYPQHFLLIERGPFTWLLAVMDDLNLGASMAKYIQRGPGGPVHRLSTALDGLPVRISNHSGLRYGVLLSEKPRLPTVVNFPAEISNGIIPLGEGLAGPVSAHAKQVVNMIVVGAQDSGKSMALRALAHAARLDGSLLCLADPLAHTFNPDYWDPASVLPVARNKGEFLTVLERVNAEINKRSDAFRQAAKDGVQPEDLDEYNAQTGAAMPRVWLIADEANSLLDSKAVQEALGEPARSGRKYGIHLVLAGHDWHEYTVNRGLTSFFETRLCLRTSNDTTGRIVLDDSKRGKRTMQFRQPGRAILRLRGQYQDLQLYYVSPDREREWFVQIRRSGNRDQWTNPSLASNEQDSAVSSQQSELVLHLHEEGLSNTQIVYKIWGTSGSSFSERMEQVKQILATAATATASETPVLPLKGAVSPQQ